MVVFALPSRSNAILPSFSVHCSGCCLHFCVIAVLCVVFVSLTCSVVGFLYAVVRIVGICSSDCEIAGVVSIIVITVIGFVRTSVLMVYLFCSLSQMLTRILLCFLFNSCTTFRSRFRLPASASTTFHRQQNEHSGTSCLHVLCCVVLCPIHSFTAHTNKQRAFGRDVLDDVGDDDVSSSVSMRPFSATPGRRPSISASACTFRCSLLVVASLRLSCLCVLFRCCVVCSCSERVLFCHAASARSAKSPSPVPLAALQSDDEFTFG